MTIKEMSKTEYAAQRGVTKQAVYAAVRSGRIAGAVLPNGKIDADRADQLWADNTHPSSGYSGHIEKRGRKTPNLDEVREKASAVGIDPNAPPPLAESKTLQAAYQARLAQIEYEEKSGKLVDADEVKKAAFKAARVTRDAILAIPDRVAAQFAGMTDPFTIHSTLTAELRGAIEEITKDLSE